MPKALVERYAVHSGSQSPLTNAIYFAHGAKASKKRTLKSFA